MNTERGPLQRATSFFCVEVKVIFMSWDRWFVGGFPEGFQADRRELGRTLDRSVQEFARDYGEFFESAFGFMLVPLNWLENLLASVPAGFFLVFVCLSLLVVKRYISAFLVPVLMAIVGYMASWNAMTETMSFLLIILTFSSIFAFPLGVAAGQNEIASKITQLILDITTYAFGFTLLSAVIILGLGKAPSMLFVFLASLSFMFRWISSGILNSRKSLPVYQRGDVSMQIKSAHVYIANGFSTTVSVILILSILGALIGLRGLSSDILRSVSNQYFAYALFASVGMIAVGLYVSRITEGLTYLILGRDT